MPDLLVEATPTRPDPVQSLIGMAVICILSLWPGAQASLLADESSGRAITVATWGGPYQYSQEKAYFEPFAKRSGIAINIERYNGGLAELRQQVASGAAKWNLLDMTMADNRAACKQGLLEQIDHASLLPAPDGTPADQDFIEGALTECAVSPIVYAMVIAYNRDAFPGNRPTRIGDLFDLERFPGRRSLQKVPEANLEWALRSYGVPREDLYQLLSTRRGLWLAFKRLDDIRDSVHWWTSVNEPVELLANGDVTMASVYNGRAFDAAVIHGHPVEIIWDAQIYELGAWGIPKGTPNVDDVMAFIRFATGTQPLAEQTKYIPYGPARKSSMKLVSTHAQSGVDIRQHLPTNPVHFGGAVRKDTEWYASLYDRIKVHFDTWLARQ